MWKTILSFAVALFVFVITNSNAPADDRKTLPGTACSSVFSTNNYVKWDSSFYLDYRNEGNGATLVICPILKDAGDIVRARIWVQDYGGDTPVTCELRSYYPFGWLVDTAAGAYNNSVNGPPIEFQGVDVVDDGTVVIWCYLGKSDSIQSYWWREKT